MVLPVIANAMRALGIVLVAHWSNNRIAEGTDHIVYGWGFLVAILVALMLIGMRYADSINFDGSGHPNSALEVRPRAFALTVLLSLAAICVAPAVLFAQSQRHQNFDPAAFSVPVTAPGWQIEPVAKGWSPDYATPRARLAFAMHEPGALKVDVFVNYYVTGVGDRDLVSSTNRLWNEDAWHPVSRGLNEAVLGQRTVPLHEDVIVAATAKRMIWWTYWSGGRFTTSKLDVKLDRLRGALSSRDSSALVAVSSAVDGDLEQTRARLHRALGALGEIAARLQQADRN
jgi:EpsI family protein